MPDTDGERPWLTISEAAERSGRKIDAMRALVRRGRLPRRKGNRGEWLVQLPESMRQSDTATAQDSVLDNGLDTEIASLREQAAKLQLALVRTEGELATVRAVADANATAAERLLTDRDRELSEVKTERDRLLTMLGEAQAALARR